MASNRDNPPCPACGSSATLPFENDENSGGDHAFSEIILAVVLFFLVLLCALILLLLSRRAAPAALLILLAAALLWRQRKVARGGRGRSRGPRPRDFVCLDCSHNFKA